MRGCDGRGSWLLGSLGVIPERSFTMVTMTRDRDSSAAPTSLLVAFELGQRSWKLGFSTGVGQRPRVRQIPAGAVGAIAQEILRAKVRLGVPLDAPAMSCY